MNAKIPYNERISTRKALVTLALAGLFLFSGDALAVEFTPEQKSALKAGKTVRTYLDSSGEKGFYGGTAYTVIDAPVEVVWEALMDWSVYSKIFAATSDVKEVSRKGDSSLIHYKMGYKYISLEYYLNIRRDESKHVMSFSLVENKPHDISASKGYWRLFPQKGGRTLVAYVVSARIPMGLFNVLKPQWKDMIQRNLVGAPNDVKRLLASSRGQKYFMNVARN